MHKPNLKIFIACIFFCLELNAQTTSDSSKTYLKVYLDGFYYGNDYVIRKLNFVSYVRDRFEAQVHVLFAYRQTGAGGQEFTIFLTGQKEFAGKNDTLKYSSLKNAAEEEIRSGAVQVLKMGLLAYVAKLPNPPDVQIQVDTT